MFVCYAKAPLLILLFQATAFDPQVLMREHPELYAEMVRL